MSGPKVGREVYDTWSGRPRAPNPFGGRAVGQRTEDEFRAGKRRVFGGDKGDLAGGQRDAFATTLVGGGEYQVEPRVFGDERAEFTSGVATRAKDAHRNSMHE